MLLLLFVVVELLFVHMASPVACNARRTSSAYMSRMWAPPRAGAGAGAGTGGGGATRRLTGDGTLAAAAAAAAAVSAGAGRLRDLMLPDLPRWANLNSSGWGEVASRERKRERVRDRGTHTHEQYE